MKDKTKIILYSICLAGCVGLAVTMSVIVFNSWTGGPNGTVDLTFNTYHERLLESIIFPLWAVIGCVASYALLKIHCDNIDYKKTVAYLQKRMFIPKKHYPSFWVRDESKPEEEPFEIER